MSIYITLSNIIRAFLPNKYVSHLIFPEIIVPGFPLKAKTWGKDMFKVVETLRAKYANSNIIRMEGSGEITIEHECHDAVTEIDLEHEPTMNLAESKIRAAKRSREALLLKQEVNVSTKLQDASIYPTGNKITLSGNDQWSSYSTSDPVKDVFEAKAAISSKIGMEPNRMVMAKDVFDMAIFHPQLAQVNPTTLQVTPASVETLKARFGVDDLVVAQSLKLDESTNEFVRLWQKSVVLLYVNPNPKPDKEDMSFGYQFRERGDKSYPYVDEKQIEENKVIGIRANDKYNTAILSTSAGYLISSAIA